MWIWKEKYSQNLLLSIVLRSLDQADFRNVLKYAVFWVKECNWFLTWVQNFGVK